MGVQDDEPVRITYAGHLSPFDRLLSSDNLIILGVLTAVALGLVIWRFPREEAARRRLPWLFALLLPWLLPGWVSAWLFARMLEPPVPDTSAWGQPVVLTLLLAEGALAVLLAVALKGARVVAVASGAWNLYMTVLAGGLLGVSLDPTIIF